MSVCSKVKGVARHHEYIADLFSLMAVGLLFGSIWVAIEYQALIIEWMRENTLTHGSLVILGIIGVVFMIVIFLNIGSARFSSEEDDRCFGTFKGRRHGGISLGKALSNWLHHIEQVNKKHR